MLAVALIGLNFMPAQAQTSIETQVETQVETQDILTILKHKSAAKQTKPPKVIPYNYVLNVEMWGREDGRNNEENIEGEQSDEDGFSAKLLIDPSLIGDSRVMILSVSHEDYPDDFKEFLQDMMDADTSPEDIASDFWCEGIGSTESNNVNVRGQDIPKDNLHVLSETETEAVVKPEFEVMTKFMMGDDDGEAMDAGERKMMKKMIKRIDGEFVYSKPDGQLRRMKVWMTRPMTIKVIATLKAMEMEQSCALAPNGFFYFNTMSMYMKAKALGMNIEHNMKMEISELTLR